MSEHNLRNLIREYLQQAKLMQLATSVDNQPWVCSVWFAADEDLNIYWFSSTTRRHSEELTKNSKVAAAIALPHSPEDIPRGLQVQGTAELLSKQNDIDHAVSLYGGRIFSKGQILQFMQDMESPHSFYTIKPTQFVLFDLVNFPDHPRQEYTI